jgi:Flp pilus assembly protein TadG
MPARSQTRDKGSRSDRYAGGRIPVQPARVMTRNGGWTLAPQDIRSRRRLWMCRRLDQGAAAVEMALVMPLLLFVIFALVDLSRAYDTEIQLSQAAREGVRLVSMQSTANITTRIQQAAPSLTISGVSIQYLDSSGSPVTGADCTTSGVVNAQVTVTTSFTWITGISAMSKFFGPGTFPTPSQESSIGVMQCA